MIFRQILKGLKRGMHEFGEAIGTLINSILLLVVYLIGVGLTSIIARIVGKRFIDTNKRKGKTYWRDLNLDKRPIEEYYRQF